ncbi:MAG: MFS transporter [Chloroflexota bacterium]
MEVPEYSPEIQNESLLRNRTLMAVCVVLAVSFIGIGMVVPVRVLYAQSRGASLAVIGAMASSFLLSSFLFQYPVGWLADLFGRKRMMMVGLAVQAVLSVLYLVIQDPVAFIVLRFFEGITAASVIPAARALIIDVIPPNQRGEAFGIFGAAINAGFLFGPALGGLFASTGYTPVFVGSCILRLIALIIVVIAIPTAARSLPDARARARAVPRSALLALPLVGSYILAFGDNLYFGFDLTLMPLWMRYHLGASVALIGVAYVLWAIPNVLGSPIGGRIADNVRHSSVILLLGLLQIPFMVAYGLISTVIPALVIFALHGGVYALMQPSVDANLAAFSPDDARARTQSVYAAVGLGSGFISANVLVWLYGINFRLPLFVMAAGFAICVVIGGTLIRVSEHRPVWSPAEGDLATTGI